MKVLIVHNFYGSESPSGENNVVMDEIELLQRNNIDVFTYFKHSDTIRKRPFLGLITGALSTPYNHFSRKEFKRIVSYYSPDIIHVHNTFPLISSSIFLENNNKVPTVMTLHNYRLVCPSAIPSRNGSVCTLCIDTRNPIHSIKHSCYRNSRVATIPLALSVYLNRKIDLWNKYIDGFISLTNYQKGIMVNSGFNPDKLHIKPNFYPGNPTPLNWSERTGDCIFVGRISSEKGIYDLIESWNKFEIKIPLKIIGDGPLLQNCIDLNKSTYIKFLGKLSSSETIREISNSKLLIVPSTWFEGFPLVMREAFAFGTPVAVSNIGPLPDLVNYGKTGFVFEPNSSTSINDVITNNYKDSILSRISHLSFSDFLEKYNERVNIKQLLDIYTKILQK